MWKWKQIWRCGVTKKLFYQTCLAGALRATLPAANKRPRSGQIRTCAQARWWIKNYKKRCNRISFCLLVAKMTVRMKGMLSYRPKKRHRHKQQRSTKRSLRFCCVAWCFTRHSCCCEVAEMLCRLAVAGKRLSGYGASPRSSSLTEWSFTPRFVLLHRRKMLIAWFGFGCRSTHPNPGSNCWWLNCIVGNKNAGFWQGRRLPETKKKRVSLVLLLNQWRLSTLELTKKLVLHFIFALDCSVYLILGFIKRR